MFASSFIMSFGKHEGKYLYEVPSHYLHWLLGQEIERELRAAIEETLQVCPSQEGYISISAFIDCVADMAARGASANAQMAMLSLLLTAAKRTKENRKSG